MSLFNLPDKCPAAVAEELMQIGLPASCVPQAWEEYKQSVARLWHEAQVEQAAISRQNFNAAHRPIDGLGQVMFRMGRKMQQVISLLSSTDARRDKQFRKQLIADNPQFCFVPKFQPKASIIKPA